MSPRASWLQRSIGARIIVLFLGLLLAVQLASFTAMRASLSAHARHALPDRLLEGERLLQTLLDRKVQTLTDGARMLAADYAFREALNTGDLRTIGGVLENHGARIGATATGLLATDFSVRTTTASSPSDLAPLIQRLAAQASVVGRGSAIALLEGRPYQAVLVPVKSPLVIGWVMMAFPLDPQLAIDLRSLSGLDLTLLTRAAPTSPWIAMLTSLDTVRAASLVREPWTGAAEDSGMTPIATPEEELGVRTMPLGAGQDTGVLALLSLSIDDALRAPRDLQLALIAINLVGLSVFFMGSVFTARQVTTPLRGLAAAAERLGAGDYVTPMQGLERHDEIGELSQAFERMRSRIAENQEQILRLAYWDGLTGLPNRARFRAAVDEAIGEGAAEGPLALILLDLDRFKHVNDVLGHRVGDELLGQIARRLQHHVLRDGDMVARLGGDEFGFLVRGGGEAAIAAAQRIARAFETPIEIEEHRVDISAGIGVACWPAHADDGETLLVRAEMAMVAAKRRGDGPQVYDPAIDVTSAQTLTLMTELRHAVERGELRLYLQPKISLDDWRVVGAETLVRWQHPQRGFVPPMQFVPFAEQTGFIRVLTMWIFEEAARHWKTLVEEGHDLTLSVNLSTRDLMDPELPRKFQALLLKHLVPASAFCFEITESAIMDDPQRALVTLDALSAMGFRLSIDDFGTGYSSLAYLKRLPVDELKIDQSFVIGMRADSDDETIVRSTIALAHNLEIDVVAEGVESAEAWDLLREMQCDQAQGFHMGQPMPVSEFSPWCLGWYAAMPIADVDALRLLH